MSEENSFLLVDYVAKIKESGEIVHTTIKEEAEKAGIYKEGEIYKPELIILGSNEVVKGFEKALKEAEINQEKEVEVPPEEGYGQRDPTKVKIYSLRKLERQVNPEDLKVGNSIEINGKVGVIKGISSGRVVIDFNPPLAGKTLVYKFKVLKKIEDEKEKISLLLSRWFPRVEESKFLVEISGNEVTIRLPPETFYVNGLQVIKRAIFSSITKYISKIEKVTFIESYEKEKPKEEKATSEAAQTT